MKFANTLEFNAVREWSDFYVDYDRLKRLIYEIEKAHAQWYRTTKSTGAAGEQTPLTTTSSTENSLNEEGFLLGNDKYASELEQQFLSQLSAELDRVNGFYMKKEQELVTELNDLMATRDHYLDLVQGTHLLASSADPSVDSLRDRIRKRTRDLYINFCSLKDYVVLNYTAFNKILKKHDKVLDQQLKQRYLPVVERSHFWRQNYDSANQAPLNDYIDRIVRLYSELFWNGNDQLSLNELSQYLREFVVWERNTVWRDMVGNERRVTAAGVKRVTKLASTKPLKLRIPLLNIKISTRWLTIIFCCLIFLVLINLNMFDGDRAKQKCFALLAFASLLWSTEVLPLFVTSMSIPLWIMLLGLVDMPAKDAAGTVIKEMFSPVIMFLLGGFTIAAALSKYHITKSMATFMLSRAGTKSHTILLVVMVIAAFASMWISNVATPVLCFSVIQPILRTLEPGDRFAKSLIMGIALASNIGGMLTPISSPQNAIALEVMKNQVSWFQWLSITLPVGGFSLIICWLMLILVYEPHRSTPLIQPIRASNEKMNRQQYFILFITILTIILWCFESKLRPVFGHSGVIALLPMVVFFGCGILDKDDFNSFLWTVAMLAMGGMALGYVVKYTQLLQSLTAVISEIIAGQSLWMIMVGFCSLLLVVATFISHTVSALIVLPIVMEVGLPLGEPLLLVMGSAIMCSGAMGLPVSGFPNIFAVSCEDATGETYVGTKDFLKVGIPISIIVCFITVTLGYGLMLWVL